MNLSADQWLMLILAISILISSIIIGASCHDGLVYVSNALGQQANSLSQRTAAIVEHEQALAKAAALTRHYEVKAVHNKQLSSSNSSEQDGHALGHTLQTSGFMAVKYSLNYGTLTITLTLSNADQERLQADLDKFNQLVIAGAFTVEEFLDKTAA